MLRHQFLACLVVSSLLACCTSISSTHADKSDLAPRYRAEDLEGIWIIESASCPYSPPPVKETTNLKFGIKDGAIYRNMPAEVVDDSWDGLESFFLVRDLMIVQGLGIDVIRIRSVEENRLAFE
jgi:hypothetical protein